MEAPKLYLNISSEVYDPYNNTMGEKYLYSKTDSYGQTSKVTRSIADDLKPYAFPDDIKAQADAIYNKMIYRVRRGKIRIQMLYFCVYNAHIELGRDVNTSQLGAIFGLTPGEVQKTDSLFSELQTGYKAPSSNISPLKYLPDYCREMQMSEDVIPDVLEACKSILEKDKSLKQENPQTVAAGFLRYYTMTRGIVSDDNKKIIKVTHRSTVTIDNMYKKIAMIDNS